MEKSKLEKYREERARHLEKIADLQKRVRALDQRIMENESMEIRALMRSENVTLEELTALVRRMQQQHRQPVENTAPAHEEPSYQRPASYSSIALSKVAFVSLMRRISRKMSSSGVVSSFFSTSLSTSTFPCSRDLRVISMA